MATYQQLQREIWWSQEFQPPNLAELCRRLREFYNVSAMALGSKGDNNHLRGYHRSAAWIRNSAYCTNRAYSVSETVGNRNPGDPDWLCAIDMTIPRDKLIAACQRLDEAVRAGRLEKVTEWYGNDDGNNLVDGYNNIANRVATSDDSHLWHLHMSFDRGRADENHDDLYRILTGTEEDMAMRFAFAADVPGIPPEIGQQVHITDGIRYRLQPKPGAINALLTTAGAGVIVQVTKALLPAGYTYAQAVAALCGTLDTGEAGGGGVTEAQVHDIARTEISATKLVAQ